MGMKVTKFVSNSPEVLETIPEQDRSPTTAIALQSNGISDQLGSISDTTKIVGLCWNPENDTLSFEQYKKLLEKEIPSSKRSISAIIPSIFDVNGEIEPYILRGKVILSETWAYTKPDTSENPNDPSTKFSKLTWDESLPAHLDKEFREWIRDIELIANYKVKRYLFGSSGKKFRKPPPAEETEIHAFSDGGGNGYGIVVFVRWEQTPGKFGMRRIFASSRIVSSTSSMSVPRRELNGIVMAAKKH